MFKRLCTDTSPGVSFLDGKYQMATVQAPELTGAFSVVDFVLWPFRKIGDVIALRRLRHQLPNVRRRLINTPHGIRTETDAEYLARLEDVYTERYGGDSHEYDGTRNGNPGPGQK